MTFTPRDAGCYARACLSTQAVKIIQVATANGMPEPEPCSAPDCLRCATEGRTRDWSWCLYRNDIVDEASDYMNEHHVVPGYHWSVSDYGDWGLWLNAHNDCPPCAVVDDGECDTCTRRERVP